MIKWEKISLPFGQEMREALQLQHHAAQLIALCGRHLLPQQPDDSNTNMEYLPEQKLLAGNPLPNGLRIALHFPDLALYLMDKNLNCQESIPLTGKTKKEAFDQLKRLLEINSLDVSGFNDSLHYAIPPHPLDQGAPFLSPGEEYLRENTFLRHNADLIIRKVAAPYPDAAEVKIWPHHFDTGTFIPYRKDSDGNVTVSFGMGWAIPDDMVEEPYFYLSVWSAESEIPDMKTLPAPEAGEWITTGWKGGILRHSLLLTQKSPEAQKNSVHTFFESGLEILHKNIL